MRVDKFLKVSRIIKRRTVAAEAADGNRVLVNGKAAKPGRKLKIGDELKIYLSQNEIRLVVKSLNEKPGKADAVSLYEIMQ